MKHFTIDAENIITVHASRKAARDTGAGVFATEEQFADLIGPDNKRLVAIFNSLQGVKPVTKFVNRKAATERIWRAVQELGVPAPVEPASEKPTDAANAGPIPVVETPIDPNEAKPGPVASEPYPASDSASVPVEAQASHAPVEVLATVGAQAPDAGSTATKASKKATRTPKPAKSPKEAQPAKGEGVREGSKTAQVVALLKRENGATLQEIMQKMSWQKHTVRGFMAGAMKKAGYTVESFKPEGGERTYRINK
jgi:hypothetical protein